MLILLGSLLFLLIPIIYLVSLFKPKTFSIRTAKNPDGKWSRGKFTLYTLIAWVISFVIIASGVDETESTENTAKAPEYEVLKDEVAQESSDIDQVVAIEEVESVDKDPGLTISQKNAVRSANNYLSFQGFSRKGLIEQLSSSAGDGYDVEDATVAVDSLDVNWTDQAVKSAKNYLGFQGFSRKGLIEQLSSSAGDGFTVEQATYGAQQVGICE